MEKRGLPVLINFSKRSRAKQQMRPILRLNLLDWIDFLPKRVQVQRPVVPVAKPAKKSVFELLVDSAKQRDPIDLDNNTNVIDLSVSTPNTNVAPAKKSKLIRSSRRTRVSLNSSNLHNHLIVILVLNLIAISRVQRKTLKVSKNILTIIWQ